ncbi:DNA ligase (ATP) [Ophidiomyces ophidiicola]|nr:DNA ligase (ATP) [Ophidiomyces ophidiicola]KAI2415429.1 DNA ligase (ATP) [Ophidiomyces ophidiicola]KAI2437494.1 DNA ligase (ATP) [Ophidiomyces ophidiicola]
MDNLNIQQETEAELDEKYPNRPHNKHPTLPFHELFTSLFNPLNENKKKPTGSTVMCRKLGPRSNTGMKNLSPQELRRDIIQRFISRWRNEVGDDIYPAFRLIIPEKDRDRAMYGLKEKTIGKLFVKIMKIDKNSEDGFSLLNWKLPSQSMASRMAGDFAGRCYEVISKRPMKSDVGTMTIQDVNDKLDRLAAASKEDEQFLVLEEFYRKMNPEELMWLVRIILRQMKVGATERTFFEIWHPDAESLYSISSSLRRVCWELHDPNVRLEANEATVTLMQCFQPQLAQFQMHSFQRMIDKMRLSPEDSTFWIEEKLDGERMQLHMASDESIPGGKRFRFWSRKAKDYTYLYGNGLFDKNGALTRHLLNAFTDGVVNIILDGEMITWDPEQDAPVPFGTLKTAALSEQRNPFSATGHRPLFRIFDILYLNDKALTRYTLQDRRKALEASIKPVHRRFEIHTYEVGHSAADIEPQLRKVVAEASEGLVLKNPNSPYRLNERHDDWMKVKPDYMTEFGESLDCVVVGGYFGSGKRGGALATFLCGLRVDESQVRQGANPMKCYSFCKVGGGFTAADYANIRHHTDGKWKDWDSKNPPKEFLELAGGDAQYERPDVWIRPDDSVVLCVKAAAVTPSDQFRLGLTVRFPRFKRLRMDKDWRSALSIQEFMDLKANAEREQQEKEFRIDNSRRKRPKRATKKPLIIAGYVENELATYSGPSGHVFDRMNFFVMTDALEPKKVPKVELEQLIKANGGKIYQTNTAAPNTVCIAERRTVKVASVQKTAKENIIRPLWLFDCLKQNEVDRGLPDLLMPLEPRHMYYILKDREQEVAENVDRFLDSYARDTSTPELKKLLDSIPRLKNPSTDRSSKLEDQVKSRFGLEISSHELPCWLFQNCVLFFSKYNLATASAPLLDIQLALNLARFAGAVTAERLEDSAVTHVVTDHRTTSRDISSLRSTISKKVGNRIPHLVTIDWVNESWKEKTLLDEQRFAPIAC